MQPRQLSPSFRNLARRFLQPSNIGQFARQNPYLCHFQLLQLAQNIPRHGPHRGGRVRCSSAGRCEKMNPKGVKRGLAALLREITQSAEDLVDGGTGDGVGYAYAGTFSRRRRHEVRISLDGNVCLERFERGEGNEKYLIRYRGK